MNANTKPKWFVLAFPTNINPQRKTITMTAELRAEIENRILALKPQKERAWASLVESQEKAAPYVAVMATRRAEWCQLHGEIRELETLLGEKP
jgi:hypothetical protein